MTLIIPVAAPFDHKRGGDLTVSNARFTVSYLIGLQLSLMTRQTALYYPDNARNLKEMAAKSQEPILPLTEWLITCPEVKERTLHEQWEVSFLYYR